MTSRMNRRLLVTAVSVLASVSLASAQGLSGGGAASEKGTSVGQAGGGISQSATGASHGEGMRQDHKAEPREAGRAPAPGQTTVADQTQTRTHLTAQQQTTLQQSVLHADNAPRVNVNSINFQVHTGVAVPSDVEVASVSTYPALIDAFPAYRDDSFFVVEDEVVFVDRDRHIVDVVPAGPRTRFSGGSVAVDLSPGDIRVVQRVLIERGLLHGRADGILGPKTRNAISAFQRQQGIQVTGSIDARTVSSLGVSGRLSQQANQSIGQSQSSQTGAPTSTIGQGQAGAEQVRTGQPQPSLQNATGQAPDQTTGHAANSPAQQNQPPPTTGQGQAGTGQAPTGQPQPNQQNATGQAPNRTTGQAASSPAQQNQPSTTTGQSMVPNQSNTTRQAAPRPQSEIKPTTTEYAPSDTISLTFTDAAIGFILLALGAFIIMPAV
ncbi:peptidoglycan-binding protein [Nitrobacter sp. NHB1]|uniref:peptidoglycan-binding domain-containing protein n=1 Tax=Nitrobacter sp. NHB1 TaxID=3119830 RepID=UPI002FFE1EE0